MIIGITGTDGAGKGTIVDYLVSKKNFAYYHARALIMQEIKKRGMEGTRVNLRLVANDLRKQHGNDYIVVHSLKQAAENGDRNIVIDSIRTVAEAETLKKNGGILLSVDADQNLRYERIVRRGSSSDHVSLEEFIRQEAVEMSDPDPNGLQKAEVMGMADYTILNNISLQDLHDKIDVFLARYS